MHQTGNTPVQRFARLNATDPIHHGASHAFAHHLHAPPLPPGAYPYYPPYFGHPPPPPPTMMFPHAEDEEDTGSPSSADEHPPMHPASVVPFQFGHPYHHHNSVYPPQNQYFNQLHDCNYHAHAGPSSPLGVLNKHHSTPERNRAEQLGKKSDKSSPSDQNDHSD